MKIRHKGRDYQVFFYDIEIGGEVMHRLQISVSPKGRNVQIYLNGKKMAPS